MSTEAISAFAPGGAAATTPPTTAPGALPAFTLDLAPATPAASTMDMPPPATSGDPDAAAGADPAQALLELLNALIGPASTPAVAEAPAAAAPAPPPPAEQPLADTPGATADPALLANLLPPPMPAPAPPHPAAPLESGRAAPTPLPLLKAGPESTPLRTETEAPATATAAGPSESAAPATLQTAETSNGPRFELLTTLSGTATRAGAEPAAPASPAPPAANLEEFAEQVVWQVQRGLQEARIHLRPDNLGTVEVQLQLHEDQASLVFTAEQPQARAALQAALPQLTQMLAGQGLMLADAQVQSQNRGNTPAPPPRRGEREDRQAEPAPEPAARRRLGLVDHYA